MYKNSEGYPDPTAYNAIQNQGAKAIFKDGMVIKIPNYNDNDSRRVLLKVHNTFATTVEVFKDERNGNVPIKVNGGTMYIEPGKIGYTKMQTLNLGSELCTLSDDEYFALLKTVAADLGIKVAADFEEQWGILTRCQNDNQRLREKVDKLNAEVARISAEADKAKVDAEQAKSVPTVSDAKINALTAERDLYKHLYDGLIEKMLTKISA